MADTERDLTVETAEAAPIDAAKGAEIMEKFEKESRTRNFSFQPLVKAGYVLCLIFTVYHLIFASGMVSTQNIKHHAVHVGMVLVLGFLFYPALKKSSRKKVAWYDWICIALSVAMPCYVFYRYMDWTSTGFRPTTLDIIMGTLLILLVMECSRRISGPALTILSAIFLIYGMYGRYFPGIFQHRGYTWTRMVQYLTCDISGIYGSSVKVSATFIVLFIIFGEVMNKCGMGQFFNDIANALAKVAVLASGFLGSINGSAVANVVTTGTFTIPLMKKTGYSKEFAGAVEATASVGGQLLPPIMGAAAFVMAETLGVQYPVIIKAAVLPALIYYLGIILQVQMRATKDHLHGIPKDQLPRIGQVMRERGHLLIPIIFLLYMLIWSGKTVIVAAFWTIIVTIVVAQLRPISRMSVKDLCDAFVAGAKSTISVAIACACVGIIVGVCAQTGFALSVASAIVSIGRNAVPDSPAISLFLTLLFTMVTCMILGMGLPSIPSYLITATIAAPALVELGVPDIAAHMFCFYFAMFANLTPPVALASFAAAGLSGGNPMKTGVASVKLALAGFIIPYMFVYNQKLMLENVGLLDGIQVVVTSCVGVLLIAAAVEGYLRGRMNVLLRLFSFAAAVMLIDSQPVTDIIGVLCLIVILALQMFVFHRHDKPNAAAA